MPPTPPPDPPTNSPSPDGAIPASATAASDAGAGAAADTAAELLARVTGRLPAGERRPEQEAMCRAVAAALAGERHLVVQAGTGTGKSLAYTVPAVASGRKVVVATATKALQDQLAEKDLPMVAAALGEGFTYAVLKGRSNYLCRQRAAEVEGHGIQQQLPVGPDGGGGGDSEPVLTLDLDEPAAGVEAGGPGDEGPDGRSGPGSTGPGGQPVPPGGAGAGATTEDRLVDQVRAILRWSRETATGDRGDLPFEPHPRAWAMLSVGPRECPGAFRCPSGRQCFAEDARARAAAADVVVVNTHLYGAHLASGGAVLPEHDVVVFDEAHEVEAVMTDSLGAEVTPGRFRALQAMARPLLDGDEGATVLGDLAAVGDRLREALGGRVGRRVLHTPTQHRTAPPPGSEGQGQHGRPGVGAPGGGGARVGVPGREGDDGRPGVGAPGGGGARVGVPGREGDDGRPGVGGPGRAERQPEGRERERQDPAPGPDEDDLALSRLLELAATRLERCTTLLRAGEREQSGGTAGRGVGPPAAAAPAIRGSHSGAPGGKVSTAGRWARALSAAGHLAGDVGRIAARTADEVAWVDGTPRLPALRLSPIDVGPPLAEALWGEVTAVLTSATVPPGLAGRLGLGGYPVDELSVGSPFDYRSHSLLYVARHLPDRRRPESEPALLEELAALVDAAGGRTLALFTSRRATEAAAAAMRARLPYPVLVQGELPKARLLEAFTREEPACLFATLGFWQGVDVPGRSLSLVTLDRLPFGRPDDPLLEARRERAGADAFRLVDLPRAATLLAQGTGRLIRTATDYGVVAVLDPRLATAGYRRVLLAGLPPMRRTTDRRQVEEFLHRILTGGTAPAGG